MPQCPFCNLVTESFESFGVDEPVFHELQVVGGGRRGNAKCPQCGSLDRERLIYLYLIRETSVFCGTYHRILHIAPEQRLGQLLEDNQRKQYVSGDRNERRSMIKLDITSAPLRSNTFSIVICNHVLEHVVKHQDALAEIYRVLVPGGLAILQVPIARGLRHTIGGDEVLSMHDRLKRFGQRDHVRLYGADYPAIIETVGFHVEKLRPCELWGENVVTQFGLIPEEQLIIAHKVK